VKSAFGLHSHLEIKRRRRRRTTRIYACSCGSNGRKKDGMRRKHLGNHTQESVLEGLGKRAAITQRQQRHDETGEQLSKWQSALITCRAKSTYEKNLLLISNETSIEPQRKEES
jgi:hypothetical protein